MGNQQEIFMRRTATFPNDDVSSPYRYHLGRYWDDFGKVALWIMLNPSTADAFQDDPTIRRCIEFSRQWGMGCCEIMNLFAYRSPNPDDLKKQEDPVGPLNTRYLRDNIPNADMVICAWGKGGGFKNRSIAVLNIIKQLDKEPMCLRRNKDGSPEHPLYIPYSVEPTRLII